MYVGQGKSDMGQNGRTKKDQMSFMDVPIHTALVCTMYLVCSLAKFFQPKSPIFVFWS